MMLCAMMGLLFVFPRRLAADKAGFEERIGLHEVRECWRPGQFQLLSVAASVHKSDLHVPGCANSFEKAIAVIVERSRGQDCVSDLVDDYAVMLEHGNVNTYKMHIFSLQ